jgi:hypothetical protein
VDLSTPGGAPRYENKRRRRNNRPHVQSPLQSPLTPIVLGAGFIEHCVYLGQADYGGIAALDTRQIFKHTFEIESAGKTAIVNQC